MSTRRLRYRSGAVAIALVVLPLCAAAPAAAGEVGALYRAYWAGLPAGEIRLRLNDDPAAYRDVIDIRTEGLPRLVTHFRGTATTEGKLSAGPLPAPQRYEAVYDLRKRRDKRLSMRFAEQAGASVAERGPRDTSSKPPLDRRFRINVLDPLSALTAIRRELRQGNRRSFTIPVYDGARRFDVVAQVLPKEKGETALRLRLTLSPIAGFKGETSEDGDPDNAPRPVTLLVSDDPRLMPLSMKVSLYYLPLVVEFSRWCAAASPCDW